MKPINYNDCVGLKTINSVISVVFNKIILIGFILATQLISNLNAASTIENVIERGMHLRKVKRIVEATNTTGQIILKTNLITQLRAGMHYLDDSGEWRESIPQFKSAEQGLSASETVYKIFLSSNLNVQGSVVIKCRMPLYCVDIH